MNLNVNSEIGDLEGVIVHTPGQEVENMTPNNAERALYSDILNLSVAQNEYKQFKNALQKVTKVYEIKDLLYEVLQVEQAKNDILDNICINEDVDCIRKYLSELPTKELARQLVEGVPIVKDNLTKFMSKERYTLPPLHNFFFTRDASITINDFVLIARMKNQIREREALIMETIFNHHPEIKTKTLNPIRTKEFTNKITIEGGDILVARNDVLIIGFGSRTTTQGIDFLLEQFKAEKRNIDIIVQELPQTLESFIHLDMVFTLLDVNKCMSYDPVVFNQHSYETVHIRLDNGKVKWIREATNILAALKNVNIDLEPIYCGGESDDWVQEREQWHSGANFFAVGPGKVLGYGRNTATIEALNKNGFEVIKATEIDKFDLENISKYVITIDGSELARGGGGCRCMTMPIKRKSI